MKFANSGLLCLPSLLTLSVQGVWHVVAADGDYPSDDAIVAFCEVTDAVYNLPADTAHNDCTAAFQSVPDYVTNAVPTGSRQGFIRLKIERGF